MQGRKWITGALCTALLFTGVSIGEITHPLHVFAANFQNTVSVTLNGTPLKGNAEAGMINGTVYGSLKEIGELLGAEVTWAQGRKEATAKTGKHTLIMRVGSSNAILDNKLVPMGGVLVLEEGTAMAPVRFVAEAFGAKVVWNSTKMQVEIQTGEASTVDENTTGAAVSGDSNTVPDFLTFSVAQERAKRFSNDYQNALISAEKAKISNEDLTLPVSVFVAQLEQQKQALKLADKVEGMMVGLTGDMVENSIKTQMEDLHLMFDQQKNLQGRSEFLKYKKKIDQMKYDAGLINKFDLDKTKNDYNSVVQEIFSLKTKIDAAYIKLNTALHYPTDSRENLEYDLIYEPIGPVDLEQKIRKDKSTDPYIWMANENVNLSEFNLKSYVYNENLQNWEQVSLDATQSKTNADFTQQNFEETIKNRYNQLLQMEDGLKSLEISMEQAKQGVNALWIQYDSGLATRVQVEEAQQNIPDLKYKMEELKQQHEQLKRIFETPYLAPEYAGGGNGSSVNGFTNSKNS